MWFFCQSAYLIYFHGIFKKSWVSASTFGEIRKQLSCCHLVPETPFLWSQRVDRIREEEPGGPLWSQDPCCVREGEWGWVDWSACSRVVGRDCDWLGLGQSRNCEGPIIFLNKDLIWEDSKSHFELWLHNSILESWDQGMGRFKREFWDFFIRYDSNS